MRAFCRGCYQHEASGSARAAERVPHCPHRARAAGALQPQERVAIVSVVGCRCLQGDLLEPHLQLLGDQHRHRGVGTLSHLDLRHDQCHSALTIDADKRVRGKGIRAVGIVWLRGCLG